MNQSDCSDVLSITFQGAKCSDQNQGRCHVDRLYHKITYWGAWFLLYANKQKYNTNYGGVGGGGGMWHLGFLNISGG